MNFWKRCVDKQATIKGPEEGRADYIVSRDNDLLDLGEHQGIEIVKPGEFIVLLGLIEEASLERRQRRKEEK